MLNECAIIEYSPALQGEMYVGGAKNAVLVIMASLILTHGKSRLTNVPCSDDVFQMIELLHDLGAVVEFIQEQNTLLVDTTNLKGFIVRPEIVKKIRASILILGPLLARFGRAQVALPGGDMIGARPIDFHLKAFAAMGARIEQDGPYIKALAPLLTAQRFVLEYPSVGATENIMMAAALVPGKTSIINAAIEPEVLDLMRVLQKMGASITLKPPMTIEIEGVMTLQPVDHEIMPDRLEVGTLLVATAISGGTIILPQAQPDMMDVFLDKLADMGHTISTDRGITLKASVSPRAVSFKTMPYPGFPTDLQPPMMAALCVAQGTSTIHETVHDNRLLHVRELQKMGAQIMVHGTAATIRGVDALYGTSVIATDIRASAALVLAGLAARGITTMTGVHHLRRGYQELDKKLIKLGAKIALQT